MTDLRPAVYVVTRRVLTERDDAGYSTLLAAPGQRVSAAHARELGIPEDALQPVVAVAGHRLATADVVTGDADPADVFPRHAGGGMYELANGERVRGKDAAAAAQATLDAVANVADADDDPDDQDAADA